MRCDDVKWALANSIAEGEEAALAEHLGRCDHCSAFAAQGQSIQRLWQATRPVPPAGEAWDRVWSGVLDGLEAGKTPAKTGPETGSGRRWGTVAVFGLVGLAQAAALMIAVGLSWTGPTRPVDTAPAVAVSSEPSLDSEFEIEDGQVALIRSEGKRVELVDLTDLDSVNGEDPWFVFFNRVEGTPPVVAMAE